MKKNNGRKKRRKKVFEIIMFELNNTWLIYCTFEQNEPFHVYFFRQTTLIIIYVRDKIAASIYALYLA